MLLSICHRLPRLGKSRVPSINTNAAHAVLSPNDQQETRPRGIIEKEFPDYFNNGKFVTRISYVEFIEQAMEKLEALGLEKDLNAYKELLRVFPPGKYHPKSRWDFGMFHAPQQLCAIRLLNKMELHQVKPDREVQGIVEQAFGKTSSVWLKITRQNFWTMKGRNLDPNPLPEVLPKEHKHIARLALARMSNDIESTVTVADTSTLPDSIDKTWVSYLQSPSQRNIIERLKPNSILHVEDCGNAFVSDKYLTYYALKYYDDNSHRDQATVIEPDYNYNTLKMQFYGKPVEEKLRQYEDKHHVGDCIILALGMTGTSSHDSILSWVKMMEKKNPRLKDMNILFKLERPSQSLTEYTDQTSDNDKG